jgi:hypothetical protein
MAVLGEVAQEGVTDIFCGRRHRYIQPRTGEKEPDGGRTLKPNTTAGRAFYPGGCRGVQKSPDFPGPPVRASPAIKGCRNIRWPQKELGRGCLHTTSPNLPRGEQGNRRQSLLFVIGLRRWLCVVVIHRRLRPLRARPSWRWPADRH